MARTPPAEGYRYSNQPPDSHPVRSAYQRDQSFGWVPPAASGRRPRGGDWIGIGDHSKVGERLLKPANLPSTTKANRAEEGDQVMDRNSGSKRIILSDSEFEKRAAPGGRLPLATAKNNALGDPGWKSISEGSPAAVAAEAERQVRREKPELVAKRQREGK
jgi:hypothetical protein